VRLLHASVLGMRSDCEVLIHVNIEQALAGQIPVFRLSVILVIFAVLDMLTVVVKQVN